MSQGRCVGSLAERYALGGGTLFDLDGKILGKLPGGVGGHGVTVADSGDIYVAQLSGDVQKFISMQEVPGQPSRGRR